MEMTMERGEILEDGNEKKRMRTMVVSMWNTENECEWGSDFDDGGIKKTR
jgi:hypothetical protein